jgi:pseudouridine kinase
MHSEAPVERGTSNPARLVRAPGGVARNVAENLARLGVSVALFSAVGDDAAGAEVIASLAACGVDVSGVEIVHSTSTPAYVALLEPGGELVAAAFEGRALERLSLNERTRTALRAASWLFVDANVPAALVEECAGLRRTAPWRIAVDATSVAKARRLPADLSAVDLLFVNADESRFAHSGAACTVTTLGARGVEIERGGTRTRLPAPQATVVDVTGAGDALVAGTLYGLVRGATLEEALVAGLRAASLTVARAGSVRADLTEAMLA